MATKTGDPSGPAPTNIELQLLVDGKSKRVLYAEAGKDFVDFLFGLLELPLGTILSCLVQGGKVLSSWSLGKIYDSVRSLPPDCFQNQSKISLLEPNKPPSNIKPAPLLQELASVGQEPMQCGKTSSHSGSATQGFGTANPAGSSTMGFGAFSLAGSSTMGFGAFNRAATLGPFSTSFGPSSPSFSSNFSFSSSPSGFSSSSSSHAETTPPVIQGYVNRMTYVVMDDLSVQQMSIKSIITTLRKSQVDVGCLEDKVVQVDIEKALELLKTSFVSTTVLTDVFLAKEVIADSKAEIDQAMSDKLQVT